MVGAESYRHPEKWAHLRKTHWRQHRAALPSALRQQGAAAAAAAAAAAVACAPSPGASSTCATTPAGLVLRSSRVVSGGAAWCVRRSPKLGSRSSTNSRQQLAGSKAAAAVCLDGFLRCLRARAAPTRAADGHRLPDAKPTAERHAPSPTLLVRRPQRLREQMRQQYVPPTKWLPPQLPLFRPLVKRQSISLQCCNAHLSFCHDDKSIETTQTHHPYSLTSRTPRAGAHHIRCPWASPT